MEKALVTLNFELGSFEGFNFRQGAAIERRLTAQEVVNWDHAVNGEAEFRPAGDHEGISLIFKEVTPGQLVALDALLGALGSDSLEYFARIFYFLEVEGCDLPEVTPERVRDLDAYFFAGTSDIDVREAAANELFELLFPALYAAWVDSGCEGMILDPDRFLDSPSMTTCQLKRFGGIGLLVVPE